MRAILRCLSVRMLLVVLILLSAIAANVAAYLGRHERLSASWSSREGSLVNGSMIVRLAGEIGSSAEVRSRRFHSGGRYRCHTSFMSELAVFGEEDRVRMVSAVRSAMVRRLGGSKTILSNKERLVLSIEGVSREVEIGYEGDRYSGVVMLDVLDVGRAKDDPEKRRLMFQYWQVEWVE